MALRLSRYGSGSPTARRQPISSSKLCRALRLACHYEPFPAVRERASADALAWAVFLTLPSEFRIAGAWSSSYLVNVPPYRVLYIISGAVAAARRRLFFCLSASPVGLGVTFTVAFFICCISRQPKTSAECAVTRESLRPWHRAIPRQSTSMCQVRLKHLI